MIVPSMNPEKKYEEFIKGFGAVQNKLKGLSSKFRRTAVKKEKGHVCLDYTDPYKNKWCLHVIPGKNEYATIPFLYYNGEGGYEALRINEANGVLELYLPHFFSRFNERYNAQKTSAIETMKLFFLLAIDVKIKFEKDNKFHAELPVGVGFGYKLTKYIYLYKTFITKEMLKGKQKELSNILNEDMIDESVIEALRDLSD